MYTGITTDLIRRVYEHKNSFVKGFTEKYKTHKLVHYEIFEDNVNALEREKKLKKWNRDWKLKLIEKMNPLWKDLYYELM